MVLILTIEKTHIFGWSKLWVESDSLYLVNLFKYSSDKIPWILLNRWEGAISFAKDLNVILSHIFWVGNSIVDKLSNNKATLGND